MAAFHMSEGHITSGDNNVSLAFCPDPLNLAYHNGQKRANHFQRGQSVQFLQAPSPHVYKLSQSEKDNMKAVETKYNPIEKFTQYNWVNGWAWFYGHVIHLETMLKDQKQDEQYINSTLLTQCLQHLGQFGTSMLSLECQKMTQKFRYKFGLDTFFIQCEEAEQKGHPDHAQWIKVNQAVDNAQQAQENPREQVPEQEGNKKETTMSTRIRQSQGEDNVAQSARETTPPTILHYVSTNEDMPP